MERLESLKMIATGLKAMNVKSVIIPSDGTLRKEIEAELKEEFDTSFKGGLIVLINDQKHPVEAAYIQLHGVKFNFINP